MQGPPYFDWRLDRWKIGLALLLWVGLFVFLPAQQPVIAPQGASPIARPGQRPVVGASSQTDTAPAVVGELAQSTVEALPVIESPLPTPAIEPSGLRSNPSQLTILEPGRGPLRNSTPLFWGQAKPDGLLEILVEGRRFAASADGDGYWQFTPPSPLPVGMTWVQARTVDAMGTLLSETVSQMALVGSAAQPISPPMILTPLPFAGKLDNSTPYFSGSGPAGRRLVIFAQPRTAPESGKLSGESGDPFGSVVVAADGRWEWQMSTPLPGGQTTLWVVVVDVEGTPLSRSWPVTLDVADDAAPSVLVGATR